MSYPKIITIQDGEIVIDESILGVPELADLYWEYFPLKESSPGTYLIPFKYLWALFSPDSPYEYVEESEKKSTVLTDFPVDLESFTMLNAIKKCEELFNSPYRRMMKAAKIGVEKVSHYLEDTEITDGKDGNFIGYKNSIIDMPKLLKAYQATESVFKQEMSKNRGNQQSAVDEDAPEEWD